MTAYKGLPDLRLSTSGKTASKKAPAKKSSSPKKSAPKKSPKKAPAKKPQEAPVTLFRKNAQTVGAVITIGGQQYYSLYKAPIGDDPTPGQVRKDYELAKGTSNPFKVWKGHF